MNRRVPELDGDSRDSASSWLAGGKSGVLYGIFVLRARSVTRGSDRLRNVRDCFESVHAGIQVTLGIDVPFSP